MENNLRTVWPASLIVLVGLMAFIIANVWAFQPTPVHGIADIFNIPMAALGEVIPQHRWATVVTADLVLGWCLVSILIAFAERSRWRACLWILFIFAIGNAVTAVYLLFNLPRLARKLAVPKA